MKKALITGITGQDGSYLAELLLEKGYEVHGIIRRASTFNTDRIDHLYKDPHINNIKLFLHYGDLSDGSNLNRILSEIKPNEIYHLGAQSHVRVSFDMPEYTGDVTGLGTLRLLDAMRETGLTKTKFYQASSSEMFGKTVELPLTEKTPFHPRSPYGVAKLYAYWITKNYREAYGMFASNGILFNHETVSSFMPMFCKETGSNEFNIKPIREIVTFNESLKHYQSKEVSGVQVWSKQGWVDVTFASAYPHDTERENKHPRFINARSGAFMATSSHVVFMKGGEEKETGNIAIGDCIDSIDLPKPDTQSRQLPNSEEEAELMGMMVGDGSATYATKGIGVHAKFTNSDPLLRQHFDMLWKKVTGGHTLYYPSRSGFNQKNIVGQLQLAGGNNWLRSIDIYNKDKTKRVPKVILNAPSHVMLAFLRGYNVCDGLKANPCTYEFKNFKTNSPTLAMGLWYLIDKTTQQNINLTVETKDDGRIFYSLNILTTTNNVFKEQSIRQLVGTGVSQREMAHITGISRTFIRKIQHGGFACDTHHLKKEPSEVKKILEIQKYDGWFYDLETSSGEFHCGIGKARVHNSPRRGETFVTRKITRGLSRIQLGKEKKLYLGNLDAKRDWGYAKDFVYGMWLILQHKNPDDFILATNETHTVREFIEETAKYLDMDIVWKGKGLNEKGIDRKTGKTIIEVDLKYFRPAEVDILLGDYSKAKNKLGWKPNVTFKELAKLMVMADLEHESKNSE